MDKKVIDIVYGVVAVFFSLFMLFYLIPTQIVSRRMTQAIEARMFPQFAVMVMAAAGLALVLVRLKGLPDKTILFRKESYSVEWKIMLRQLIFVVAMVAYISLLPVVGFIIMTIVFVYGMLFYFGSLAPIKNIVISVIFSSVAYWIFASLFRVRLPSGWLPF